MDDDGWSKRVMVDFDGTIFRFGPLYDVVNPPFDGAAEVLDILHTQGYEIVIFTSRASERWLKGRDRKAEMTYVEMRLRQFGIPYDAITGDKWPAKYYVDDCALRFNGDWWATYWDIVEGPIA